MKLGSLELKNILMLAPMLEVTTGPYRRFCRQISGDVGLVCVPMLYTKRIEKKPSSVETDLHKIEGENPISVQLIGSDTESIKKSVLYLESYDFDIIDFNAGCPSRRAVRSREGGYLLNDLTNLANLVSIIIKFSSKPVSLKVRNGFEEPLDITKFSRLFNDRNLEFITFHSRTVKDKFQNNKIDLNAIKELKTLSSIPIVANGDIDSVEKAREILEYTSADALMIGRESIGNPTIFRDIDDYLSFGVYKPHKYDIDRYLKYIEIFESCIDEFLEGDIKLSYSKEIYKFRELYKNSIWLTKNLTNSTILRHELSGCKNIIQLKDTIHSFAN
jgi:tRNA-dihydrouridine synthase B